MKKILILSSCADNMSAQLGFPGSELAEGNYKNMPQLIRTIKGGEIKGAIIDGSLSNEDLYKLVVGLRQANIRDTREFPLIILGGEKEIEGTKKVSKIEDLKKYFK
jgi:hypothetical protein